VKRRPSQAAADQLEALSFQDDSTSPTSSSDNDEPMEDAGEELPIMADSRNYLFDDEEMVGASDLSQKERELALAKAALEAVSIELTQTQAIWDMTPDKDKRGIRYVVGQDEDHVEQHAAEHLLGTSWDVEIQRFWTRSECAASATLSRDWEPGGLRAGTVRAVHQESVSGGRTGALV